MGKLGSGVHSNIYAVSAIKGQKQIIRTLKVVHFVYIQEGIPLKEPQIKTEVAVLKSIKDTNPDELGFAQIYEYGYESNFNFLIMTLLGPNLEQLMKLCGGSFTLKTTAIISLQVLDRL